MTDKHWFQILTKVVVGVIALGAAYIWFNMTLDADPEANGLPRLVGGLAGIVLIFFAYRKTTETPQDRVRKYAQSIINGDRK